MLSQPSSFGAGGLHGSTPNTTDETQTNLTTATKTAAIKTEPFGVAPDGKQIYLYTLSNRNGMVVKITNYGAIVTSVITPDKKGQLGDIVLGFNSMEGYVPNNPHFGGIVGRFANRIEHGEFTLNGQKYTLAKNDFPNHLHGGNTGFDRVVWNAETLPALNAVKLTYLSRDREEGYPGNLNTTVIYTLTDDNALKIAYEATTDKATPVNLTNHSYFNLSAGKAKDILNHVVTIHADKFTEADKNLIPTGKLAPVQGTPYDFTSPQTIGSRINTLDVNHGYDVNYVINKSGNVLTHAATVCEPTSGRTAEVHTTQPGIQLYTGYHLDGSLTGKNGVTYERYAGLCLETQHFPDSPNQENFPSTILKPGDTYRTSTAYKFSVKDQAERPTP